MSKPLVLDDDAVRTGRRRFLRGLVAVTAGLTMLPALAKVKPAGERILALHHLHTGESLRTPYWSHGEYLPDALADIDYLLRDFRTDEVKAIDPRLMDLLYTLRQRIGTRAPFQIISGYRSPATNEMLRRRSNGVAKHSLHMEGMAVDIRLSGCRLATLRKAALAMERGGVGYYPKSEFVHVDVGGYVPGRGRVRGTSHRRSTKNTAAHSCAASRATCGRACPVTLAVFLLLPTPSSSSYCCSAALRAGWRNRGESPYCSPNPCAHRRRPPTGAGPAPLYLPTRPKSYARKLCCLFRSSPFVATGLHERRAWLRPRVTGAEPTWLPLMNPASRGASRACAASLATFEPKQKTTAVHGCFMTGPNGMSISVKCADRIYAAGLIVLQPINGLRTAGRCGLCGPEPMIVPASMRGLKLVIQEQRVSGSRL